MPPIQLKEGKCTELLPAASFEDVKEDVKEEFEEEIGKCERLRRY
jgi:hypothetical protein